MHYGYGLHTCYGQYIATAHIVQVVKALLKRKNLRRAEGEAGQLKLELPYPVSMRVEFDA
jgi:cytochrome P450